MTCFSIQKYFRFVLLMLVLTGAVTTAKPAHAQISDGFKKTLRQAQENSDEAESKDRSDLRTLRTSAPIVIELYTATDCTACVFADRMLYDSMKNKNVIALSCRIQDLGALQSSDEKRTANAGKYNNGPMDPCIFRQWTYKAGRSDNDVSLAIPTFIINGNDEVNTSDLVSYENVLKTYSYAYKNKVREIFMRWKDKDTITVSLPKDPIAETAKINASVWLIRYKDMAVEKVDFGQNKGRVLRFSNIVQDIRHISKWHGTARDITVDVPVPQGGKERGGYVIVVSKMMGEPFLAAGKLEDYAIGADAAPVKAPASKGP